jgi:hypothetical protein
VVGMRIDRTHTRTDLENLPSCPHPQPLSQAWERGARAVGEGGVRARDFDRKRRLFKPDLVSVNIQPQLIRSCKHL